MTAVGGVATTRPRKPRPRVAATSPKTSKSPKASNRAAAPGRSARVPEVAAGVLWAGALITACAISPLVTALLVVPAAVVAALSAVRAIPSPRSRARLVVVVGGPAVAAVSFVIAASQGANLAVTLVFLICFYDCACYLNGSGHGVGGAIGVGAGLVTVAVLALFVAAVFVPPFTGTKPWIVLGLTVLLAPAGVWLAGSAVEWQRLPALRRIDSSILAAPAWVVLVALVVNR